MRAPLPIVVDGTSYGRTRPAWYVMVPALYPGRPACAFVGATSREEAQARALEYWMGTPDAKAAQAAGVRMVAALDWTAEPEPTGETMGEAIPVLMRLLAPLADGAQLVRVEPYDARRPC